MSLDLYSHILATGGIIIFILMIVHIFSYLISSKIRELTQKVSYFTFISIAGVFTTIATLGSLAYQFIYNLNVCELCWWQRIFMFPIEAVVLFTLIYKIKENHRIMALLSAIGIIFSTYHYSVHLQKWVLKTENVLSLTQCTTNAGEGSCTSTTGVMAYGFFTIPLMAWVVFALVLWLCFLANKKLKLEK